MAVLLYVAVLNTILYQKKKPQAIAGLHLTSWQPRWCTLNKRILLKELIFSFGRETNMAGMSICLFRLLGFCENQEHLAA